MPQSGQELSPRSHSRDRGVSACGVNRSVDDLDLKKIEDALHRLFFRGETPGRRLSADAQGWYPLDDVCVAVSQLLHVRVAEQHLRTVRPGGFRVEISNQRLARCADASVADRPMCSTSSFTPPTPPPSKLHERLEPASASRALILSSDEVQAWRAAHRLQGTHGPRPTPYGHAARRTFYRNRHNGLYSATSLPLKHVLNLHPEFDVQLSAGGIPVRREPDGQIRMALIQVRRRSGVTWEVAKGKLEVGETPEGAAVREVGEEMGVDVDFRLLRHIGQVRYGFLAPRGLPRLKTISST